MRFNVVAAIERMRERKSGGFVAEFRFVPDECDVTDVAVYAEHGYTNEDGSAEYVLSAHVVKGCGQSRPMAVEFVTAPRGLPVGRLSRIAYTALRRDVMHEKSVFAICTCSQDESFCEV